MQSVGEDNDWQTYQGHDPGKQAGSYGNQVVSASEGEEGAVRTECQHVWKRAARDAGTQQLVRDDEGEGLEKEAQSNARTY